MNTRQIITFPKDKRGLRSKLEKQGVEPLAVRDRVCKKLLITGTGRCGTTHLWKLLNKVGMDVGHEYVGMHAHGVASMWFHTDARWYPNLHQQSEPKAHVGERRSDFVFYHTYHLIRTPLKTIPSMAKVFSALHYDWFEENGFCPVGIKSKTLRCAYTWLNVNKHCESISRSTLRIEDINAWWPALGRGGVIPQVEMPVMKPQNRGTGYRSSEALTYEDLKLLDGALTDELYAYAKDWGY